MKKNNIKRRLASTRNMSKQDKRRVQLHKTTKYKTEQETRSGRVMFSRPDGSAMFVRGNRADAAARTPLNKRLIALVLAIVMILALIPAGIFMLRPKAEGTTPMGDTVMTVRVNGTEVGEAKIKPGVIATNISNDNIDYQDVKIPDGAEYVKALLVDNNGVETPIYSVASKGETSYYSVVQNAYTGVSKDDDETFVLEFANKYYINFGPFTGDGNGNFTNEDGSFSTNAIPERNVDTNETRYFIYGGQDLEIKAISPNVDRNPSRVTYQSGGNAGSEKIVNSMVSIPSNMYAGDIDISINFNKQETYTVQDARYMKNSTYYSQYYKLDNHGGSSQNANSITGENTLDDVDFGETATFYIYSQNNTTNQHVWRLSMLSINGVDMQFPKDEDALNVPVSSAFRESNQVTVKRIADHENMGKSDDRTVYEVKVSNVHENLEINYYFTDIKQRQLIIKGLNGINKTAASVENKMLTGNLTGKWYTYTSSNLNVYEAFYDSRKNYPADNLVLYTVKPGYNPYAISTTMYADGENVTDSIRATTVTGTPVQVIKQAGNAEGGNFNTDWRFWGENKGTNAGELINTDKKRWGDELLLTTLKKDKANTWYAVALAQSKANNQQLVLNAPAYPFAIEVDLDGGTLDANGYVATNGILNESSTHTISDGAPYMFMPAGTPVKPGAVFTGYRLVAPDGNTYSEEDYANDVTYKPSDRIDIDSLALDYAYGNRTDPSNNTLKLRFKAIWKGKEPASVSVATSYQTGLQADGTKDYSTVVTTQEGSAVGDAAVIDDHTGLATNPYYVLNSESIIVGKNTKNGNNNYVAQYDYNIPELKVTKKALGNIRTKQFKITVVLKEEESSPVDFSSYYDYLRNKTEIHDGTEAEKNWIVEDTSSNENHSVTLTFYLKKDASDSIPVPYGWHYTVSEEAGEGYDIAYSPNNNGAIQQNTSVFVTNTVNNSGIHSNKTLSGPDQNGKYSITMEAYATGDDIIDEAGEPVPMDIVMVIDQSAAMGTEDMHPHYTATESKNWTVNEVTGSGQTYYYKVGEQYYPVQAKEGTLYEPVQTAPTLSKVKGWGHDGTVFDNIGSDGVASEVHFNVPTNYYALDRNNKIHKVYLITVGEFMRYASYAYYYTDNDTPKDVYEYSINHRGLVLGDKITSKTVTNMLVNEDNPYNNGEEWQESIGWLGSWNASQLYKTMDYSNENISAYGSDELYYYAGGSTRYGLIGARTTDSEYVHDSGHWEGSDRWISMAANGQVCLVGYDDATKAHLDEQRMSYSWITSGSSVNNLYLPKGGVNYNALCYIDENGDSQPIGHSVDVENATAYSGKLYTVTGDSRVSTLQKSARQFVQAVAENAKDNNVDHRVAMVGFAGNRYPTVSSGTTAYNTTKNDYTNTGLFVNGGFKNYQTLTSMESTSDRYTNMHYYTSGTVTNGIPAGDPVIYQNGSWKILGSGEPYSGSFYDPIASYDNLTVNDYQAALVEASKKTDGTYNGDVADDLDTAIRNFAHYGGSYTSYGMTMANNIFENNTKTYVDKDGNPQQRKRVIVVFTCGEPGGQGYSESIAGEALVDGNRAKYATDANGYDATVYTIGLFPGNASKDTERFMRNLSSHFTVPVSNVFGGNNNGVSKTGSGNLDGSKTYYITDTDGKTLAVTTKHEGLSTLGWWQKTDTGYVPWSPKYKDPSGRTDDRPGTTWFYDKNGNQVSEEDVKTDEIYFINRTTHNASTALKYEYRWYDSNNKVRDPIKNDYGEYDTDRNTWQFFELGKPLPNNDGNTYYYDVKNEEATIAAFKKAFETMADSSTRVSLGVGNSYLQDTVSEYFDVTGAEVSLGTVTGFQREGQEPEWSDSIQDIDPDVDGNVRYEWNGHVLKVENFKYNENHIAEGENVDGQPVPGKKLIVTISGLTPKDNNPNAVGFDIPSNTDESGVYEIPEKGEDKLIEPFRIPEVNRPQHKLLIDGDDKNAKYTVKFKLLDKDGQAVDASYLAYVGGETPFITATFEDGVFTWKDKVSLGESEKLEDSIIFENFDKDDANQYQLVAVVEKDGNDNHYTYEVDLDGSNKGFSPDSNSSEYNLPRKAVTSSSTTHITSARKTAKITLNEQTIYTGQEGGSADEDKVFDIILTLKDGENAITGKRVYSGIEFNDGVAVIKMKHDQTRTLELPEGFNLAIDVDPDTQDLYIDSYKLDGELVGHGDDKYNSTPIVSGQAITIINATDYPTPTGFNDRHVPVSLILLATAGILGLAAAGAYVYRRKRRVNE